MTRQAIWKEAVPSVPMPKATKKALVAYAEAEGLKLYRAAEKLLAKVPELKPYLEAANE